MRCVFNAMLAYSDQCERQATHMLHWSLEGHTKSEAMCCHHAHSEALMIRNVGGSAATVLMHASERPNLKDATGTATLDSVSGADWLTHNA